MKGLASSLLLASSLGAIILGLWVWNDRASTDARRRQNPRNARRQ